MGCNVISDLMSPVPSAHHLNCFALKLLVKSSIFASPESFVYFKTHFYFSHVICLILIDIKLSKCCFYIDLFKKWCFHYSFLHQFEKCCNFLFFHKNWWHCVICGLISLIARLTTRQIQFSQFFNSLHPMWWALVPAHQASKNQRPGSMTSFQQFGSHFLTANKFRW